MWILALNTILFASMIVQARAFALSDAPSSDFGFNGYVDKRRSHELFGKRGSEALSAYNRNIRRTHELFGKRSVPDTSSSERMERKDLYQLEGGPLWHLAWYKAPIEHRARRSLNNDALNEVGSLTSEEFDNLLNALSNLRRIRRARTGELFG